MVEEDRELVAALAGGHVAGPDGRFETAGDINQEPVSGLVAVLDLAAVVLVSVGGFVGSIEPQILWGLMPSLLVLVPLGARYLATRGAGP